MLVRVLKRAKELSQKGIVLPCSEPLLYFMQHKVELNDFDDAVLERFSQLDDTDIIAALKAWQNHNDFILSNLSKMIVNRDLLKIKLSSEKYTPEDVEDLKSKLTNFYRISQQEASYFIFKGKIKNQAYNKDVEPIKILKKDRTIEDVVEASDQLNLKALSKPVTKYYLCFPKVLLEKAAF